MSFFVGNIVIYVVSGSFVTNAWYIVEFSMGKVTFGTAFPNVLNRLWRTADKEWYQAWD